MSLKEEIENLILQEQKKLATRERKENEFHARQRQRFAPLRKVLDELLISVESAYLRGRISDQSATIEVGKSIHSGSFETDIRWEIEPNFGTSLSAKKHEGLFYEEAGFRVEETEYFHSLELYHPESADPSERTHIFATESQACEYLGKKVAEKVAFYRRLGGLANRTKQS